MRDMQIKETLVRLRRRQRRDGTGDEVESSARTGKTRADDVGRSGRWRKGALCSLAVLDGSNRVRFKPLYIAGTCISAEFTYKTHNTITLGIRLERFPKSASGSARLCLALSARDDDTRYSVRTHIHPALAASLIARDLLDMASRRYRRIILLPSGIAGCSPDRYYHDSSFTR